ncbi:MAG: hypothetical protein AAF903_06005 [Pseudomonadota bacterium]
MSDTLHVMAARAAFYDIEPDLAAFLRYTRAHGLDVGAIGTVAGHCSVTAIVEPSQGRFEFAGADDQQAFPAFVCEAYGPDGESAVDLVAWPIGNPTRLLTALGQCAMLGAWNVWNPATYYFNEPLNVHRAPLDWMKSGCQGAAIVCPHLAARELIDAPGRIAAQDHQHGRELTALIQSLIPRDKVVARSHAHRRAA